jgi:hypothetical protein
MDGDTIAIGASAAEGYLSITGAVYIYRNGGDGASEDSSPLLLLGGVATVMLIATVGIAYFLGYLTPKKVIVC